LHHRHAEGDMPKQRPPFDTQRYEALKAQGLSQRAIAQEMGMPEATLRNNLKVLAQAIAEGVPMDDQGIPQWETTEVHQSSPEVSQGGPSEGYQRRPLSSLPEGNPEDHQGLPPLYVHPGIPDDSEESPVGSEEIEGVHEEIPALPLTAIHEGHAGSPVAGMSPEFVETLTTAWPELAEMLSWWRTRKQVQETTEKLARTTWHVAPRWVEAVRREADLTGESYAAVVNRAFATYFRGRPT
jgi:hypothetical protein